MLNSSAMRTHQPLCLSTLLGLQAAQELLSAPVPARASFLLTLQRVLGGSAHQHTKLAVLCYLETLAVDTLAAHELINSELCVFLVSGAGRGAMASYADIGSSFVPCVIYAGDRRAGRTQVWVNSSTSRRPTLRCCFLRAAPAAKMQAEL